MSQPVQPPNQPQQPYGRPVDGNPYAAGPGQGVPSAPTGNPYGQQGPANPHGQQQGPGAPYGQQPGQQAPFGGGAPFAPAPPARGNLLLGIGAALGVALVAGVLYGVLAGSIEREVGYAAVGVGFLVGFVAGKLGGSNPVTIAAAAVFSIGAVYLGQLVGNSMDIADAAQIPFSEVVGNHADAATQRWSERADLMTYLFLVLSAVAAVGGAKKAG
ncbi:hypothetical protein [Streptomyces californicus]|uniref:hypothetical protein n=1 Tax=Streptomyces californicus TaxID=67351 RepID=UPI003787CE78